MDFVSYTTTTSQQTTVWYRHNSDTHWEFHKMCATSFTAVLWPQLVMSVSSTCITGAPTYTHVQLIPLKEEKILYGKHLHLPSDILIDSEGTKTKNESRTTIQISWTGKNPPTTKNKQTNKRNPGQNKNRTKLLKELIEIR